MAFGPFATLPKWRWRSSAAADALAVDEGLRRRLDVMLGFEAVGHPVILDLAAPAFEEIFGLQSVRTGVFGVTI